MDTGYHSGSCLGLAVWPENNIIPPGFPEIPALAEYSAEALSRGYWRSLWILSRFGCLAGE